MAITASTTRDACSLNGCTDDTILSLNINMRYGLIIERCGQGRLILRGHQSQAPVQQLAPPAWLTDD